MSKSKEEQMLEEMRQVLDEMRRAKAETTATLAMENGRSTRKIGKRLSLRSISIIAIILVLITIVTVSAYSIRSLFQGEGTVVNKVSSFAEQIQELSSLATSKAYMKAVVEQEDNALFGKKIDMNIPGTKRTTLVIIPGEVTAGVDLSNISNGDVKVNEEDKLVQIVLPRAEILQQPSLFFDQVQVYSTEGLFRGTANIDEGYEIAELASEQIKSEAIEQGLLSSAEQQAKAIISKFIESLGYEVQIQFEEGSTQTLTP